MPGWMDRLRSGPMAGRCQPVSGCHCALTRWSVNVSPWPGSATALLGLPSTVVGSTVAVIVVLLVRVSAERGEVVGVAAGEPAVAADLGGVGEGQTHAAAVWEFAAQR